MLRDIESVRRLRRGEAVPVVDGTGRPTEVQIYPRPVQPELPIWVTAGGSPDTFRAAGGIGANLLTHLLAQDLDDLARKIAVYREARERCGHDRGRVALMVHTYLGDDLDQVREVVRRPFCGYLRSSFGLLAGLLRNLRPDLGVESLSEEELDALLEHAFDRFYDTAGLLGTPASCLAMVDRLRAAGVDEVACLIDFGIETEAALGGLERLVELIAAWRLPRAPIHQEGSVAAEIMSRGATHFQCTPSLAGLLTLEGDSLASLRGLR